MERTLASVRVITDIQPIPEADAIEVATVDGWNVVVKKGEFQVGDLAVYCEIDSVLPERPEFDFLAKVKYRIKTIKLRGQISQGILFPLSILQVRGYELDRQPLAQQYYLVHPVLQNISINEGLDVTELLDITKYDPPLSPQLAGTAKGRFPSFLIKTDEERVQNLQHKILDKYAGTMVYVTEKLDGSSFTAYLRHVSPGVSEALNVEEGNLYEFGVCSRNLDLQETEGNYFWEAARKYNLEEILATTGEDLAIQGEIVGPGIQGNKYGLEERQLFVFNVFDIKKREYYNFPELQAFLEKNNLQGVPLLTIRHMMGSVEQWVDFADGWSYLNDKVLREGVVVRPLAETYDPRFGRVSFKAISNTFLLKNNE